eukprot:5839843-Ditylum_brightwellii.AAC.1
MGYKDFLEDNCHTTANISTETLKILGEYRITDQTLKKCECIFTTDNGLRNTGEEGFKTIVSKIICTDHKISTVLMEVLNKNQWSIDRQPKLV